MGIRTVLVVDDHATMRGLVGEVLQSAGFATVLVQDALSALPVLNDPDARIAAVVTDIHLGDGPDGWTLARHARQVREEVAILYMTADGGDEWRWQGVPESGLIQKPFAADSVIAALGALL